MKNLSEFNDFNNQTIISVGTGGEQFLEFGYISKDLFAIDNDNSITIPKHKIKNII